MIASTLTAMASLLALVGEAPTLWTALQAPVAMPLAQQAAPAVMQSPLEDIAEESLTPTPRLPAAEPEQAMPETNISAPDAQPVPATPLTTMVAPADQARILGAIENALSTTKSADGRFTQVNADGSVMTGTFALRRPGRMRFDYDDPTPILIVSDGTTVAMEDSELETVDRVPLSSTPLGLILDNELSFENDVDVLRVAEGPDKILVTVEDRTGEIDGELTMIFAPASYDLLGWMTVDADLQMTQVELSGVRTNGRIDPRLFRLDEAEDEDDER